MGCCGGGGHGSHGNSGDNNGEGRGINQWIIIGAIILIALFVFSYLR